MAGIRSALGPVIAAAAIVAIFMMQQRIAAPPAPSEASAFNVDRAIERLSRILGDERPHSVDTEANDAVRARLLEEIRALGFEPIVRDDFHCAVGEFGRAFATCARVRNVLFWVTAPGPNAVMIASHYDSVPAGPGAADDGAGVAASLEIAAIVKERSFDRPALVLVTDGEEAGLIGASSFVKTDPLADQIGAVVNMEARGVRGAAALIETSRPNGRDLRALASPVRLPAASSLNTDIYELLPNGTDMTEFLSLDIDAANLAFAHGARLYHTPGDNLENLHPSAVFHLGASGLAATEAFLGQDSDKPEHQRIYAEVLGQYVLSFPQSWGMPALVLGAIIAALFFVRTGTGAPVRSASAPLLAVVLGVGFAVAAMFLLGALRSEPNFGAANPWAVRAVQLTAGVLGAGLAYALGLSAKGASRLLAAAWFWFAAFGTAGAFIAPGAMILFAPPLAVFAVGAAAALFGYGSLLRPLAVVGAVFFLVLTLRLAAHGEAGLFVESAAPFIIVPIFLFTFVAPLVTDTDDRTPPARWGLTGAAAIAFAIALVIALLAPAYSALAPRHVTIAHIQTPGDDGARWSLRADAPPPRDMGQVADFALGRIEGLPGERYVAPAPPFETAGVTVALTGDETRDGERTLSFDITAPDSDIIWAPIGDASAIRGVMVNDQKMAFRTKRGLSFACHGRACRALSLTLRLDAAAAAPDVTMFAVRFGLGPEGAALTEARPDWATPIQWGDIRAVVEPLPLDDGVD